MKSREIKSWLAALILGAVLIGIGQVHPAWATQGSITPASQTAALGGDASLTLSADDDLAGINSRLVGTILFGPGQFVSGSFAAGTGGVSCTGVVSATTSTND